MFLGVEAIDEEGLKRFRKRVTLRPGTSRRSSSRGRWAIMVAINIIADPDWDHAQFEVIRQWCLEIPEIVNISVNTPYPGTETLADRVAQARPRATIGSSTSSTRCFRHELPLARVLRGAGPDAAGAESQAPRGEQIWGTARTVARLLAHGQTNFLKMLFKFNSVYDPKLQMADHARPVRYEISLPPEARAKVDPHVLYIHKSQGRRGRQIDNGTERFVEDTRMGVAD